MLDCLHFKVEPQVGGGGGVRVGSCVGVRSGSCGGGGSGSCGGGGSLDLAFGPGLNRSYAYIKSSMSKASVIEISGEVLVSCELDGGSTLS